MKTRKLMAVLLLLAGCQIIHAQNAENGEIHFDFGRLEQADYSRTADEVKDADVILFAGGISSAVLLGSMKDRPQRSSRESRWSMQRNSIRRNTDGNSRPKRLGFK